MSDVENLERQVKDLSPDALAEKVLRDYAAGKSFRI